MLTDRLDVWQACKHGADRDTWRVQMAVAVLSVIVLLRHPKTWRDYRGWDHR